MPRPKVHSVWPHLRALLIGLHVVAVVGMAIPAPEGGMNKGAWKDPTVQAEFDAWYTRFQALGLDLDREAFEDALWEMAVKITTTRRGLLEPFRPYYKYAGTAQSWRMFVAPHTHPARLHIDIREDGQWRTVYIARSDEHTWLGHKLDHDRLRSAVFRYAWKHYGRAYEEFALWLASEAARDFPEADRLRARYHKFRTRSAKEVRAGTPVEGRFINVREVAIDRGDP